MDFYEINLENAYVLFKNKNPFRITLKGFFSIFIYLHIYLLCLKGHHHTCLL